MLDVSGTGEDIPLDLPNAPPNGAALGCIDWPTSYDAYEFLSRQLVDGIAEAARAAAVSSALEAVVEAKLYDTVTDLALIARLALDLHNARVAGRSVLYDRGFSTWLHFLDGGCGGGAAVAGKRLWHYKKSQGAIAESKRRMRRWHSGLLASFSSTSVRHDVLSRNTLLDEFLDDEGVRKIDVSPNYRDWPACAAVPTEVRDLIEAMVAAFRMAAERATGGDSALKTACLALARPVVAGHVEKAWADLGTIRRLVTARSAGSVLVGGTPKHVGRLFAWHYKRLGRSVWRFAHGGERAFYDDYAWSLAELPYCDRYFCHSRGEAARLSNRRIDGRMVAAGLPSVQFLTRGSHKHREIRVRAEQARHGPRTGTVMYVAGGYLGEELGDFPSRKPPDVLYYEWQVWLLKALRAAGYCTVVKLHPKGVLREANLLRPFCDEIVGGYFQPNNHSVDCYVFDFAGAAFFDALASGYGIVLADMGIRPHDPGAFDDLRLRCEVISCWRNERNLFRANEDSLADAVEVAATSEAWPDSFFETYLHG